MQTLKRLINLLTQHERERAALLLIMILMMALLDMLGVASVMPFMALLSNPQLIETNSFLNTAYVASGQLGVNTPDQFLFALGILVFLLLVGSLAFKALTTFVQLRFTLMREYSIGKRLVEGYLHQPYSWFLDRHSADLGKTILSEVSAVINLAIVPTMNLITQSAVAISLLTLLFVMNPELALIVGLTLAAAYGFVCKITSSLLLQMGTERLKSNQERFAAVSEAFSAAKEVKLGGLEHVYTQRFAEPAQTYARHQANAQVISQLPRFMLEAIAFGGMLLVVLYTMVQYGDFTTSLPIVTLYAFAGYRLMPALQQIYVAITQLRFAAPALESLHEDLMSLQPAGSPSAQPAMPLTQDITLNNITYRYPSTTAPALMGVSLSIPAKTTVGIVGATGSGKTTMVDLIMGLLDAQTGEVSIDGRPITMDNKRSWQSSVGYVPQQIVLTDASIAANIAFGIKPEYVDQVALERAAKVANLHEFITNELPLGYGTRVGERGVRLSGGQRQRIGIARALYHCPQVLILDEATSALDSLTEQAVMEAIHNLGHKITIILIAHRLSTVKACDNIFLLDKGCLKGQGRFEDLRRTNEIFQKMVIGF